MRSRISFRAGRLAVALLALTTVVSCSGNTTSPTPPTPPLTTVPPETPSSTPLLWPLAGQDGRDWVITGATFSDSPLTFTTVHRHSYWFWNRQLSSTPGVWTVSILVNGMLVQSETVTAT